LGKIPPHGSDAGSYLAGEVFGARSVILIKDVDGVYSADPKTHPEATFIPEIRAGELMAMELETLPLEPVVLELLTRSKLVKSVRVINGLVRGNLTKALAGEDVGTVIRA
jgi:molybdenum storage protein